MNYQDIIGRKVHVVIDRSINSVHPNYPNIHYELNYGYIPNVIAGDGEGQDAYILGEKMPLTEFDGVVIAIIHRLNDNEDKWCVTAFNKNYHNEEIVQMTNFIEQYFQIEIIR